MGPAGESVTDAARGGGIGGRSRPRRSVVRRLLRRLLFGRNRLSERALAALALADGDTVVDVGCGSGDDFRTLRDAVGPTGTVVGVDADVTAARERVRRAGWDNVHVARADPTSLSVCRGVDAAVASFVLRATADPDAVVEHVYDSLRPGGRFVVFDTRPYPRGALSRWTRTLRAVASLGRPGERATGVLAALDDRFETVRVVDAEAGSLFVAVAEKADGPSSRTRVAVGHRDRTSSSKVPTR